MNKGEHLGPEAILQSESQLVGQMVRAFRHGETEAGMAVLGELGRACFNEGAAAQRRKSGELDADAE